MHKSRLEDEMVEKMEDENGISGQLPHSNRSFMLFTKFLPIIGTISKSIRILDWGHKPLIPTNINNKRP